MTTKEMKHGSLFSGIGGFDLAAEWMGWENVFHCEWEDFPRKVLKYHWPKSISYGDITKTDFTIHRGRIDIITGGFPCQPYSQAGKQLGTEDDRHLWPEMLRAIREIQPKWVVGENVYGIVSWNEGLVFDQVQSDLENEGYSVQAYILPAAGVGAPHQRYRVWFVAYSGHQRSEKSKKQAMGDKQLPESGFTANSEGGGRGRLRNQGKEKGTYSGNELFREQHRFPNKERIIFNPDSERGRNENDGERQGTKINLTNYQTDVWQNFPTQPPVCSGDDGLSSELDGITFSKWRNESIKAYGNAIVPQVAHQIFKAIEEYNKL